MSRRLLTTAAALIGLIAAPSLATAQKGPGDSRPAVMPFGAVGADGAAAIGAAPPPAAPGNIKPAGATGPALPGGKPAPLPPAGRAAALSPTGFTPDPAITARVRQQALASALPTSPNPDALRAAVNSGRPWEEFDRLLRQHGYDPRDLADVVAAFYLIAWEVATGGDALAQPAGIAAVRGQARQMLAGNAAMARLSEAERQATAETRATRTCAMPAPGRR